MFRILITSRADADIEAAFANNPTVLRKELDITSQSSRADIVAYIRHRMAIIQKNSISGLPADWPGPQRIQALADQSAGLFVWASTAATFIEDDHNPEARLDILLSSHAPSKAESDLDALYATALATAGKWDDETFVSSFQDILGIILVVRTPLTDLAIDEILGLRGDRRSQFTLTRLTCLLHWRPGKLIRILHTSIADYLSDSHRCGKWPWFIDTALHGRNLALACLRIMKLELRFNICKFKTSHLSNDDIHDQAIPTNTAIGDHLSYSCRFWADHVQVLLPDDEILEEVKDFIHTRFLYWLEVMSLVKAVGMASPALLLMSSWLKDQDSHLSAFAVDASRFVTTFQRPISHSVPHIYISALPFAPINSMVSQKFLPQFTQTLSVQTGKATHWPAILNVIEGHTHSVTSVAFSPDGMRIASGSDDCTVRVWDAATGDAVAGPFRGHTGGVKCVYFSPDGKWISSGSVDKTIRVWDAETGDLVSGPFEGHGGRIVSIAFSPDGEHIVSGSWDKTVRVWETATGQIVSGLFEGHADAVHSVAFSPDGRQIASGSSDRTIRIWEVNAEKKFDSRIIEGHTGRVTSVAFSPDGKRIGSGSWDEKVRVWDVETGSLAFGPLIGHADSVLCVAYSSNGKHIVSGSGDKTIQVWDADTTDIITPSSEEPVNRFVSRSPHHTIRVWDALTGEDLSGPFQGHADWVNAVAFSPDGNLIASGSGDKTIQIWDIHAGGVAQSASEGHTRGVRAVAMSPDGTRIASGSIDQTVRIWDTETGAPLAEPCEGHTGRITSVAFSPDGIHIASGSIDQTIRVWNAKTGEAFIGPLKGHTGGVRSVTFSPDGRRILSGSIDYTIRLWDVETGTPVSVPIEGHTDRVTCVAFSPDGTQIASGSWDKTIRIWNIEAGDNVVSGSRCLGEHDKWVNWVTFSPDGKRVVSTSDDQLIKLWDVESGELVTIFKGHMHAVNCAAFSYDAEQIVSCSADKTIRVWEVVSGKEVCASFTGHTDWVNCVVFSPDRKRIVSCSGDKTVQIWNAEVTDAMIGEQTVPGGLRCECNGWILGPESELLFWIPPMNRIGLWQPRNVAIISHISTRLDYSRFVHGASWQLCNA